MAKKKPDDAPSAAAGTAGEMLRAPAEVLYADELEQLIKTDAHPKPPNWRMSPRAVATYISGGKAGTMTITPKYIGFKRLVEIAISTLVTDRALLLIGEPGTAKSWLSEHLAAAINGDSTKVVQGTAGTTEEQIRYTWNYAMLIARRPSPEALIKSPVFRAMESGTLARFEEITRCAAEVQDALISLLSEKRVSVPELATEVPAAKGFSIIGTANTRDRGVNDMSAALKRRFNTVVLPTPNTLETEIEIVRKRVKELGANLELKAAPPSEDAVAQVVTIFRELRGGQTLDGKNKLKIPSGVLSTAEAISVLANGMALAGHFGSGEVAAHDLSAGLQGAVVKDEEKDKIVWQEYLSNVLKKRRGGVAAALHRVLGVELVTGLHIFGVRHLSPGGAWHLRTLLDSVRPKVVLIEGLADADSLVHHITKKGTRPPIAILAYTDSVPVRTLVYPLAAYSPEFQAMLWAKENKARVEFIDLPSDIFLGLQDVELERWAKRAAKDADETEAPDAHAWRPEHGGSFYDRIAERGGEADYDAYWERRFEHNLNSESYRRAAFELGRELRDQPDEPVWRAENLVREAFMRRRIHEVLAEGVQSSQIVAVVGAFHAPVLSDEYPPMTDAELASLRRRSSKLTLMPYSYFKLSTQSGYGAGNRAPAYFDLFWEMLNAGGLDDLPLRYLSEVVRRMRGAGTHRSTAEVIEGVRLACTLAAMHDGSAPTLRDLHDAAATLVGGGEMATIAEALAHVDVGAAIGELPQGVSRTSIQEDFDRQMNRLKLEKYKKTVAEELTLDLRENRHVKTVEAAFLDLHRSSFLHRLRVLEIGFAKPLARGNQATTWAEAWKLQWSPEHEIALVEAVLLGETVELATAYKIKQLLDAATGIAAAADVVRDACQCGLSASMDLARKRLQELSAASSDLAAIAHAATALSQVVRYGDVRKFDPAPLLPLIDELFVQGSLALFASANCDNQAALKLCDAIEELNRISLEHHERVDGELWIKQLRKLSDADDRNPLLSGYACAVLLERGLIATEDLAREVSRRLSPGIPADLGAGWFEGLSKRNRAALLSRQALWVELAAYVRSLDDEQFKRAIVFLRRAFGSFSPQQKRQICENLAELWDVHADDAKEALETPLSEAEQQKLTDLQGFSFDDIY